MPFGPARSWLAVCDRCTKRIQRTAFKNEDAVDYMKEQGWHIKLGVTLCHPCFMTHRAEWHPAWRTWLGNGRSASDIVGFWTWVVDNGR